MAAPRNSRPGMLLDPSAPINQGLVAWWPMWEGAGGKCLDISGKNNHGTLTNGPMWKDGLQFDGTNDYVSTPIGALTNFVGAGGPNSYAIEVETAVVTRQCILADYNTAGSTTSALVEFGGYLQPDDQLSINIGGPNYISLGTYVVNRKYSIVASYTGTNLSGYLDGIFKVSAATSFAPSGDNGLAFGRAGNYNGLYLNGRIMSVRIWKRALSALEVQQLYVNPNIGLWTPDYTRYYVAAAGGADVRKKIISAYMRIAA